MLSTNDLRKACEIPNDGSLGRLARQELPLLADLIEELERTVAALRALAEEQREYIQTRAEIHKTGEEVMTEEWRQAHCQGCQADRALALTESEMLKRQERKEA